MDIKRLEIFLKLLETRSFSRTAQVMGLTQPSVSASLKALEEALGSKLFDRTPRAVTPLEAAEILAPYALNIVETAGRAAWAVNRRLSQAGERLTIGASSVPSEVFVPDALAEFSRLYPDVLIRVRTGKSSAISRQVADGDIDLGLVGAAPNLEELVSVPFSRDRLALLASEILARRIGTAPRAAADLLEWPLIMREEGSGTRDAFLAGFSDEAGRLIGRLKVQAEVEGLGPCLALARTSFGAIVVSRLLTDVIDLTGLRVMNLDFLNIGRSFHVVRRKNKNDSPAADALITVIKGVAKKCMIRND
ncbi:MAG: LysR family transcriptional regulator [Candidatus Adiutrix sp.]|jgi:DNA-binding transcriptional LysR family regulator|nr:LysR family transcriptional regulator [Candidatus Adiutrix sp.]